MDMISVGPQMKHVHSPDEKLHIGSTQRFWKLLVDVLENIPEEGNRGNRGIRGNRGSKGKSGIME